MAMKGTNSRPQPEAEQDIVQEAGRDSATPAKAVHNALQGFREDVIDIVRELRLDVDETLGVMRQEMADRNRVLRQELKLMGDERVRFFRRVEALLEDVLNAGREFSAGEDAGLLQDTESEEVPLVLEQAENGDWLAAQQEAEQAVAGGPLVEVDGLDGKDLVEEAEAAIQACIKTVMTSGDSHVKNVFRQVHGIGVDPPNNA